MKFVYFHIDSRSGSFVQKQDRFDTHQPETKRTVIILDHGTPCCSPLTSGLWTQPGLPYMMEPIKAIPYEPKQQLPSRCRIVHRNTASTFFQLSGELTDFLETLKEAPSDPQSKMQTQKALT